MSVLDPCLADTRHPVVANALHSFQCFQPISNAPVLIMISFHLHCNPGKEVGQDLTATRWLLKELSKCFPHLRTQPSCTLGAGRTGGLGPQPGFHSGLGPCWSFWVRSFRNHRIPSHSSPGIPQAAQFISDNQYPTATSLPWDLSISSFCFSLADWDPKLREAFALSDMKRTQGWGDIRRPNVWYWLCHLTRFIDQPWFSQLPYGNSVHDKGVLKE